MRTALLIAFHFPPGATSSGLQRTLSNALHLPRHGWRPIVLTVTAEAHDRTNDQQLRELPPTLRVERTRAPNLPRLLSIRGRYWSRLALPDPWRLWSITAVRRAQELMRGERIDAIWSTYPIATAHTIAAKLTARTRIPWIADFRDPMVEVVRATGEVFPTDPALRAARLAIEAQAVREADSLVFCTPAARQIVHERHPGLAPERSVVIPNGFDEQAFASAEKTPSPASGTGKRVLLHSGIVYPGPDRDPSALFAAIAQLATEGAITPRDFELRLRDPSNEQLFADLARHTGVADFVSIQPQLAYRDALAEMLSADGLLLLQGYTSNPAIPAKYYEYLRAGRPIVGLTHAEGETARALTAAGIDSYCDLTDATAIAALLRRWLSGTPLPLPSREYVANFARHNAAARLAALLDNAVARRGS
jgi:hypothetical protein